MSIKTQLIEEVIEGVTTIVGRKNRASSVFIRLANAVDEQLKVKVVWHI